MQRTTKAVTRRELNKSLRARTGLTYRQADAATAALVALIAEQISRARRVELRGLGTFRIRVVPAQMKWNPRTVKALGKEQAAVYESPAHNRVTFIPSGAVRRKLIACPLVG